MKPTCDIYDELLDSVGVLPAGLRHYGGRRAFQGAAQTVKTYEVNTRVRELANTPGEGRVMAVDGGGSLRRALLGDEIAAAAVSNGWAGIIIWGAVRDIEHLADLDLGVMALGHTPRKCIRKDEGEIGCPVTIDGVPVEIGDMIIADADGALVTYRAAASGA